MGVAMRERSFWFLTVCVLFLIILGGARISRAAANDAEKTGTVELKVVGPDGRPLAHVQLAMKSTERFLPGGAKRWSAQATTDDQGIARFPSRVGIAQIDVLAGDIGYGTTGQFEVVPAAVSLAPLPRLAPLAHASGEIPAKFAGEKDLAVKFQMTGDEDDPMKFAVGADRKFAVSLPKGGYYVSAGSGTKRIAWGYVHLAPGQTVNNLQLMPLPPEEIAASTQPDAIARELPAEETIVWAEGTVRDEDGNPVPDADVYADCVYHGGIRMSGFTVKLRTDKKGNYSIKGAAGLPAFSATLLAHKEGMTPAFAWISLPDIDFAPVPPGADAPTTRMATPPARHRDFVLSRRGGRLRLTVHADGKPLAGARVLLMRDGSELHQMWVGSNDPTEPEAELIAYPRGVTDASGVAEFGHLPPGQYEVVAVRGSDRDVDGLFMGGVLYVSEADCPVADASDISIARDQLREFHLAFPPSTAPIKVRVLDDRGAPRVGDVTWEPTRAVEPRTFGGRIVKLDQNGYGTVSEKIGLWRSSFKYQHSDPTFLPFKELYFEATAILAASPRLAKLEPITLTSMHVDPGSIVVQLIGLNGKPALGTVTLSHPYSQVPVMSTSTDDTGLARLDAVPSGSYVVRAYLRGQDEINLPYSKDGELPTDAQLANRIAFFSKTLVAAPNQEQKLTLRARRGAFIRGRVIAPGGHIPKYLNIEVTVPESDDKIPVWYRGPGEFTAGPLAPGKVTLSASVLHEDRVPDVYETQASITEGQINHADIKLSSPTTQPEPRLKTLMVGVGGAVNQGAGEEALRGRVVLSDGKMPADGAMVLYIPKGQSDATLGATADLHGDLTPRALWYSSNAQSAEPMGSPTHDVLVANLPGQCGATIQETDGLPKDPLQLVLPKANHVNGRVRIGEKAPTGLGQIFVRAQYQGKGKLDDFLSLSVTPQEDGTFQLNGLTPGTYQVQASLDGIWLSTTQKLVVGSGDLPDMTLDIVEPAGPVCVELVDAKGQPLRGRMVTVDRPAGPLTSALWPDSFLSDGAGHAWIPPLEAGTHTIHVAGSSATAKVAAPDLKTGMAAVVRIEVKDATP